MDQQVYNTIKFMDAFRFTEGRKANVFVAMVSEMPIHMHDGIELIYILKGEIEIKISFNHYVMKAGDFLLINALEVHSMRAQSKSEILFVQASQELFQGKEFVFDPFYYVNFHRETVKQIKQAMTEAYVFTAKQDWKQTSRKLEEMAKLCDEGFQLHFFDVNRKEQGAFADHQMNRERIKNITEYMYDQYYQKVKLSDIAGLEHIDMFYTSRLIKDGMGAGFQDTLNIIRADRAEIFLLGTDMAVQQVGETVGFSSHAYFVKQFKELFHMTPSTYRQKLKRETYPVKQMVYSLISYDTDVLTESVKILESDWQERTEDQYLSDLQDALTYVRHLCQLIFAPERENEQILFTRQPETIEVYGKASGVRVIINEPLEK